MLELIIGFLAFFRFGFLKPEIISPWVGKVVLEQKQEKRLISEKSFKLSNRYPSSSVNQVFVDNMLLSLHYLKGEEIKRNVNWEEIRKPFEFSFTLKPEEVFAFHENLLNEFKSDHVKTMKSRFIASEGYRSSGFLYGDGVCQLASLLNWAAAESGLDVTAKVLHDFSPVPDVPSKHGTSIKYTESNNINSQNQNLYIKNNFSYPVEFSFIISKDEIRIKVFEISS